MLPHSSFTCEKFPSPTLTLVQLFPLPYSSLTTNILTSNFPEVFFITTFVDTPIYVRFLHSLSNVPSMYEIKNTTHWAYFTIIQPIFTIHCGFPQQSFLLLQFSLSICFPFLRLSLTLCNRNIARQFPCRSLIHTLQIWTTRVTL